MKPENQFDVIIVGGSYSGLAAAMALGRALKKVLVIDAGNPCNRQTPYSHNFLTHDGETPAAIAASAKLQVAQYETIRFLQGTVVSGAKVDIGFEVVVETGENFVAQKLIFATGIKDRLPEIEGFSECWGISVLHCPYCHGYEVRNEKTGILGNGDAGFDFSRLISNWTKDLTLFTNGKSELSEAQSAQLSLHQIDIIEKEISAISHDNGYIQKVIFKDGSEYPVSALYAPSPFEQHCKIPEILGCELTEDGYLKVDQFQETTVKGIFATGDNASRMRTVANAVAMGTSVGISVSKQLILGAF